jgi:hypothetical protein
MLEGNSSKEHKISMNHRAHQLILHFGLPKTGTSAIQRALFEQRDKLLKHHNTLYPGQYENHFFFQALFSKQPESLLQIQRLNLENSKAIAHFVEEYRQSVLDEIYRAKPHQIIISSEYFISMNVDELKAMHEFLKSIAEKITLFAYVRDPWSWALSLAQEHIRTGWWKKEVKVTYRDSLQEIFGKFEKAFDMHSTAAPYIQGSNIVTDFCKRFDLNKLTPSTQNYKAVNDRMQTEAACVMLQLNQLYPVFDEHGNIIIDPARDWMSEAIQRSPLSKTPLRISKSTAKEIYEKSKADIEFMEERYFGGRKYFTEQYNLLKTTDFDDTLSISTFTPEQLSEYLLSCMHVLAERAVEKHKLVQDLLEIKNVSENDLLGITSSKVWKLVLFLRRIRVRLAPNNSRRERVLRRLMNSILAVIDNIGRNQN